MNRLIKFTAAKEANGCWLGGVKELSQRERRSVVSGEEAKDFYLSLIADGDRARESRRERRGTTTDSQREQGSERGQPSTTEATARDGHRLLKYAQEGNLPGLCELLEKKGCDINFKDSFYWTAIMCASYAGQLGAVRLLLLKGAAWVGVVDTQGRDARDLADQAGHMEVVQELDGHHVRSDAPRHSSGDSASQPQWCSVCGIQYSESEERHRSSTLHQFSLPQAPPTPEYCLPPSSAGYRMMLSARWDPKEGLGPEGVGRKNPIKTVLKRDRKGLGYGPAPKARVTHFKPKDTLAVKQAPKGRTERGATLGRIAERKLEAKDRKWEWDFRTSFYHESI
ncbi:hypothetical protein GJAV_G00116230 [Gymnothorax javanicus]|nr:hypothetical protein GJAV_G00116230 [Gymnothorax javanicus]